MRVEPLADQVERRLALLEGRVNTHEAVCAERQGTIISRLGRIEAILIAAVGSLVVGLLWLVFVRHGL